MFSKKERPDTDTLLFKTPNVVLSPHQAGHVFHYGDPAPRNAFLDIGRMLADAPANWVLPELRGGPDWQVQGATVDDGDDPP